MISNNIKQRNSYKYKMRIIQLISLEGGGNEQLINEISMSGAKNYTIFRSRYYHIIA